MGFEETIEDWKRQNNDPLGYWLSKLDENQLKLMEEVKNRFNYHISDFRELKQEELRDEIEYHISFEAKRQILYKHHANIINKDSFINHYRSIINIVNKDDWGLLNEKLYKEFIYSFGVIGLSSPWVFEENEIKALDFLDDVVTLNIIDRMLEVFKDNDKNDHPFNDKIFNDVYGQRFFDYVFEEWLKNETMFIAVHCVIRLLWDTPGYNNDKKLGIHPKSETIIKWWNNVYAPKCEYRDELTFNMDIKPRIYDTYKIGVNWERWEEKLNELKGKFKKDNKYP